MKILAWPAPSRSQANPYVSLVYSEFENEEVEIEPYSTWNARVTSRCLSCPLAGGDFLGPHGALSSGHNKIRGISCSSHDGRGTRPGWHPRVDCSQHCASRSYVARSRTRLGLVLPEVSCTCRCPDRALVTLTGLLFCESYPELQSCSRSIVPHPHYRNCVALSRGSSRRAWPAAGGLRRGDHWGGPAKQGDPVRRIRCFGQPAGRTSDYSLPGIALIPALRRRSKTRSATMQASYSKMISLILIWFPVLRPLMSS